MRSPSEIDRALQLTVRRFQGLVDEDGQPYLLHCLRVMLNFTDEKLQMVGLMHDLLEDTETTLDELAELGFSDDVIQAIVLLTRTKDVAYHDYIIRLKKPNPLARLVKLADLRDNSDIRRALYRSDRAQGDMQQAARYLLSYKFLEDRIGQAEYTARMQEVEP